MSIINLETWFPAYRIRMSLDHERGHERDAWNFEIPCKRWKARIYPHGGTTLQAWISTRYVKSALRELIRVGASPHQVGDSEATVTFAARDFEAIAAVLLPKRKPKGRSASDLAAIRPLKSGRENAEKGKP